MKVSDDASVPLFPGERTVVTIGVYDGLHVGHQAVIRQVRELATARGARSVVLTFDRHPATIVRPESAPLLLTDAEQRLELLQATGIDAALVLPFDAHAATENASGFVERVLVGCLEAGAVVVGEDFHFGRDREGTVDLLRKLGQRSDFDVVPVQLLPRADGIDEPISSTAIRRALAGGEVERAAQMLGRLFEVRGMVVEGDQRGRAIGFPTANIEVWSRMCLPADGVYAGWYTGPDGIERPTALNVGRRPTFYEHADHSLLEAHLIDFDGDLYGQRPKVKFVKFLRSERKFDGVEGLIAQLALDVAHARAALA